MNKYADLHVHTYFSDGTFSPEEVVNHASSNGLSCIAICDHDIVDGISPAIKCANKAGLEIVPGVEITVIKNGKEIHVLGYFVSWKEEWFDRVLRRIQRERDARMDKMLSKLRRFGIDLDKKSVMRLAGAKGSLGRLHLARALAETGAVSSIQKAFQLYIGDFKPCYVEDIGFGPREAIEFIQKANGVPVLAHPGVMRDDTLVQEFIKDGVRGIEAHHSDHSPGDVKKYEKMAKDHGLIVTGGSDCHGLAKKKILLGGKKISYSYVEKLREEADNGNTGS